MQINLARRIFDINDGVAERLRKVFESSGLLAVNVLGSPGAGKTSLIERSLEHLTNKLRVAVIEGDLATSLDADRLRRFGVPVVQINTGGLCHLDSTMIENVLSEFDLPTLDLLIIENVGNLVCPVRFDLGEACKIVVASLPEGDDKVAKYPTAFSSASVVVLNKMDLKNALNFDMDRFERDLLAVNPAVEMFRVSCCTGIGLDRWVDWLNQRAAS
ncbi:MAG: hydrogenase nickel incorporation protein HypB [Armatimonadetes bacterium]|nr:hydrogenase nickel incorporation protein HypB [Armatimonadota bacterium]